MSLILTQMENPVPKSRPETRSVSGVPFIHTKAEPKGQRLMRKRVWNEPQGHLSAVPRSLPAACRVTCLFL